MSPIGLEHSLSKGFVYGLLNTFFFCQVGSTLYNVLRGVLEVAVGIAAGGILGMFIRYFPSRDQVKTQLKKYYNNVILY